MRCSCLASIHSYFILSFTSFTILPFIIKHLKTGMLLFTFFQLLATIVKYAYWKCLKLVCYSQSNTMTFLNTSQMYRIFLLRWVGSKFNIVFIDKSFTCVSEHFSHVELSLPVERGTLRFHHLALPLNSKNHPFRVYPQKVTDI